MGSWISVIIRVLIVIILSIGLHDILSGSGIVWKRKSNPEQRKMNFLEKIAMVIMFVLLTGTSMSTIYEVLFNLHILK